MLLIWCKEGGWPAGAGGTELDSAKELPPSDKKREETVVESLANLAASYTVISGKPDEAVCCVPQMRLRMSHCCRQMKSRRQVAGLAFDPFCLANIPLTYLSQEREVCSKYVESTIYYLSMLNAVESIYAESIISMLKVLVVLKVVCV